MVGSWRDAQSSLPTRHLNPGAAFLLVKRYRPALEHNGLRLAARVLNRNPRALRLVLVIDPAFGTAGASELIGQYQYGHGQVSLTACAPWLEGPDHLPVRTGPAL